MADNYVEIRIKASDEAKPDLTELQAELDRLKHEVANAKVSVDDEEAAQKLLRLNAKLAELDRKVSNPRIKLDGAARAEADIFAVEHELDKLQRQGDEAGPTGLIGRIMEGVGGGSGSVGPIPLPAIAAIIPVIGALLVEIDGVVAGFAAAGAGAGAFALLAKPAVTQVQTAYEGLHAAQQKYQAALALENLDPSKAHAAAVKAALDQLKLAQQAISKMPASEQEAIKGLQGLSDEFGKMTKAFQPEAFKVFAAGLGLVQKLLPTIVPFANTFADVLSKLLGQASKFAGSKGFADWLKQFHSLEGPALNSIGQGIAKVAIAFGKLMTIMSGKDVAHAINIAFGTVATTLNILASGIHTFMQNWDSMSSAARRDSHDVASSFDAVRHGAAQMASGVGSAISEAVHWVATFVSDVAHDVVQVVTFFAELPGKMVSALGNLGGLLFNAGYQIIMGLLNGLKAAWNAVTGFISSIAGWIASHKGPLDYDRQLLVPHGKAIIDGLMGGMRSRFPALRSELGEVSGMVSGMQFPGRGGSGSAALQLQVMAGGGSAFEQFMVQAIRNYVRVRGGNVQSAFGH